MDSSLAQFFSAWELFRLPALASTLAGALLGWLGVYVVLRGLVFLTAAVSQAAGLGVALIFFAQAHWGWSGVAGSPTVGASVLTLAVVALVAGEGRGLIGRDSGLGLAYLFGAAGALALGTRIAQDLHDIETILHGSAVAVLEGEFWSIVLTTVLLLGLQLWWRRAFVAVAFDRDGALVRRMPVRVIEMAFFASLAFAISSSTQVLGALPTFAFSVLPAVIAVRWAPNVTVALIAAAVLGSALGFAGYVAAFVYALPVGAAQTLLGLLCVLLSELVFRGRQRLVLLQAREASPS